MIVRIQGIPVPYDRNPQEELNRAVSQKLGKEASRLIGLSVVRRSIDARQRPVKLIFSVDVALRDGPALTIPGAIEPSAPIPMAVHPGRTPLPMPPLIVGGGPAGLFAALLLAEHGFCPILVDRGGNVQQRVEATRQFIRARDPDPQNNVLFGLG